MSRGRKDKYKTHVEPELEKISEWIKTETEGQIAKRLGVSTTSFERYKAKHPELLKVLKDGKKGLIAELKMTLKKKAIGYYYEETKTTQKKDDNGNKVVIVETYKKYAQPDLGSLHLLLKNLDPDWRNDDQTTVDIKKAQIDIAKQKADETAW